MLYVLPKNANDLKDQEFVKLTARSIIRVTRREGVVWHCDCRCGGTRDVPAQYLTSNRVTRCRDCARALRTKLLHENFRLSLVRTGGDTRARGQRDWHQKLAELNDEQRAEFDSIINRRLEQGCLITDAIRAEAVQVARLVRRAA